MVKLTEEQRRELEALRNMPDDQIDFSDIPERPIDWSKARIAPFYRPIWKEFGIRLDQSALDYLKSRLADGQSLDDAVNKALGAQMFRIRFPVRVQKAERRIRRIQESPREIEDLYEAHKQEIEILYGESIEKVASFFVVFGPTNRFNEKFGERHSIATKEVSLKLDENIIEWFEYGLEDGQSLDRALNQALIDHIRWVSSPRVEQLDEISAQQVEESL